MNSERTCIYNANIVLLDEVVKGSLILEGSRIAKITGDILPGRNVSSGSVMIDAEGGYVMPGMIDIHSDAIEKEIQPRPNALFPIEMAFYELDKKLPASGITTMYHSLSLSDEWGVRDTDMVLEIIESISKFKNTRSMINHKIHIRYEITYLEGADTLETMIRTRSVDFMSYMDHTPGQGQFKDPEELKRFTMQSYGKKEKDVEDLIEKTLEQQAKVNWPKLISLAKLAKINGIRLASHDDDNEEKIHTLIECQGAVSEFPINLETAIYAASKGLHVCVGAPNIVRGRSHSNNMRAIDAIECGAADIVCSDYLPGTMLSAVFKLSQKGLRLPDAVRMVSLNPARALGIDDEVGQIQIGKTADLIIAENSKLYPSIRKTIVGGNLVYQSNFNILYREKDEIVC